MTEVLAVCQGERWPRSRGISVITGSGGLAEMILDNATAAGLDLPPLSSAERAEAERVIGRITGDGNPFDAWGNGDYAVNLPHAMSVVDRSERIGAVVYCADTSNEGHVGHPGRILENVKMLAEAAKTSHKPYYLMSSRPGVMNTQQAKAMREAGLVQIGGTRQGLGAIDRIAHYMMPPRPLRTPTGGSGAQLADVLAARAGRRTINEYDSKRLLSAFSVPVTREQRAVTLGEATGAAREIGYPVVLKVVSDDIPHKTELGLVAVGLASDEDLARAFQRLSERLDRLDPRPSDAAFLVQEFVADGVEVFAGVARDPDFGLTLAFGMGGIAIEITRDFALRALPLREGDAEAMIAETRGTAMLGAIRGRPPADVKSLAACLNALGDFAHHNADVLQEIDLNPIKALPEGRGCVVVDALIVARSPARG
jgi:acyl-CoA synthetase (NDP forming)